MTERALGANPSLRDHQRFASSTPTSAKWGPTLLAVFVVLVLAATAVFANVSDSQAQTAPSSIEPQDLWQVNGEVHALHVIGDILYIGGEFTRLIDGNGNFQARRNLAAINRVTGEPHWFEADTDSPVWALTSTPNGDTLYVGGNFNTVRGRQMKRLAAFSTANGAFTSFNPDQRPTNAVRALEFHENRLYVGGLFTQVGRSNRNYLAAYNASTSALTSWAPSANNHVKAIAADGSRIWVGGFFSRINGKSARALAALQASNGSLIATEHPAVDVIDIDIMGSRIFAAGGGPGGTAYAFDKDTGRQLWSKRSDGNYQGVSAIGDFVYFAGHHEYIDGINIRKASRHNIRTGEFDRSWVPRFNGRRGTNAVATIGNEVYFGGDFWEVNGRSRQGLAGFGSGTVSGGGGGQAPTGTAPQLESLRMLDRDEDGKVDAVAAEFDQQLRSCSAGCTDGWTLRNVPSNGRLASVSINGDTATLNLREGLGDADTSVGEFTVGLSTGNNIRSQDGQQASFSARSPRDAANPVAYHFRKTNEDNSGYAQRGDEFQVLFSEPMNPGSMASRVNVVLSDPGNGSNDRLSIPGLTAGNMNLGGKNYMDCASGSCQVTFTDSDVEWSSGNTKVTVTFGSCTGNCLRRRTGEFGHATFVPASSLRATSNGQGAVGRVDKFLRFF